MQWIRLLKEKTHKEFNKIEAERLAICSRIEALKREQLLYSPDAGSWNLLEVLSHLVKAESLSLRYIQKMYKKRDDLPPAGFSSAVRFFLLKWGLNLPVKYKAPRLADTTGESPEIGELLNEWGSIRTGFLDIIETCEEECFRKAIYKHPRAGDLNLKQTVEFLGLHVKHHEKQISNLIGSSKIE